MIVDGVKEVRGAYEGEHPLPTRDRSPGGFFLRETGKHKSVYTVRLMPATGLGRTELNTITGD